MLSFLYTSVVIYIRRRYAGWAKFSTECAGEKNFEHRSVIAAYFFGPPCKRMQVNMQRRHLRTFQRTLANVIATTN